MDKKQINDSFSVRKDIVTDFSKKTKLNLKRLYIKGHEKDNWSQHADTDKKDLDKWAKKEPFENMDDMIEGNANIIEGNANIIVNPILPDLTKIDEYEGDDFLGDFFSGNLDPKFYDTGTPKVG